MKLMLLIFLMAASIVSAKEVQRIEPTDIFLSRLFSNLSCPNRVGIIEGYPKYKYCLVDLVYYPDEYLTKFTYQLNVHNSVIGILENNKKEGKREAMEKEAREIAERLGISGYSKFAGTLNAIQTAHIEPDIKVSNEMTKILRNISYIEIFYFDKSYKMYVGYLDADGAFYYKEYDTFYLPGLKKIKDELKF